MSQPITRDYASIPVGKSRFFAGADPLSVKAAASRSGKRHGAKFKTSKQRGGVLVRRVA